jgi:hypothetical protein
MVTRGWQPASADAVDITQSAPGARPLVPNRSDGKRIRLKELRSSLGLPVGPLVRRGFPDRNRAANAVREVSVWRCGPACVVPLDCRTLADLSFLIWPALFHVAEGRPFSDWPTIRPEPEDRTSARRALETTKWIENDVSGPQPSFFRAARNMVYNQVGAMTV